MNRKYGSHEFADAADTFLNIVHLPNRRDGRRRDERIHLQAVQYVDPASCYLSGTLEHVLIDRPPIRSEPRPTEHCHPEEGEAVA